MLEIKRILNKGFTKLQLLLGAGVLVILVLVSVTVYRAINHERNHSKVEEDLKTLKGAVMAYWRSNRLVFPKDVHRSLASVKPALRAEVLKDPWGTDSKNSTYGFVKSLDPNIGEYFILYTQGPKGDTHPKLNPLSQIVEYSGSGFVVSNLPTKKIN